MKISLHPLFKRRTFLWFVGIVVCLYAVVVVGYVQTVRDLGLKSAFDTTLKAVRAENIVAGPERMKPKRGDTILKVGNKDINSWPDLLNAPSNMQRNLDNLPKDWVKPDPEQKGNYLIKVRFARKVSPKTAAGAVGLLASPLGQGPVLATSSLAAQTEFSAWCPLSRLPLAELLPAFLWFSLKLLLFVVGVLVLWKRPSDPASVQFYALCVFTLGAYIGGYHWNYVTTSPLLIVGFMFCAVFLPPVTLHFYLVFPRPKTLLNRYKARTLILVYGIPALFFAALLGEYIYLRYLYRGGEAEALDAMLDVFLWTIYLSFFNSALWYLLSVAALLNSLLHVRDVMERNQVLCILVGTILSLVPIGYSLVLAVFYPNVFGAGGATWPMFVASVIVTASFVVGITRYRLMQLDQIISSGAVYFLISFLVGLSYYAIVFLGTLIFFNQVIAGQTLADALKVSTVALFLLLAVDMARSRLRKALDRRFHREKYHLDRTLQRMGEAVQQLVDPPTLVQRLLHASTDLLGVQRGAVYLRQTEPGAYRIAGWVGPAPAQVEILARSALATALQAGTAVTARHATNGVPAPARLELRKLGGEIAYPLLHEDRLLAFLILGPRLNGPYRPEDLNLLGAFAQITVLALGSAEGHEAIEQLNHDLQAKVEKIAEQQRRIIALQSQLRRQGLLRKDASRNQDAPSGDVSATENGGIPSTPAGDAISPDDEEPVYDNIIGSSTQVQELLHMVRKVSHTDAVVLIRGESGTGKELLAEAIHHNSSRAGKAFVKVHCAALSPTLLESELFGHVKGAFTGAHRDKVGRFELANGGTLFLDEIGDVSLDVQTKLLRVLQERTFERVGSSESVAVDVRIVAATHQNLEELMRQGRFRDDLFYRLNVFPLYAPPLRERKEDIPELTLHFLHLAAQRCGKHPLHIDDETLAALKTYNWPGNIRELENVIERAVVLVEGNTITPHNLPEEIRLASPIHDWNLNSPPVNGAPLRPALTSKLTTRSRADLDDEFERDRILQALEAADGNKAEAARALGIPRSTLVSRLKKYGVL